MPVCVDAHIVNGIVTPILNPSDSLPKFVEPYTLQPIPLWGSGNYGTGPYEDYTQWQDTVLHVMNIPPREVAGTPGGCMPIRGALIYTPIPLVKNQGGTLVTATDQYLPPTISADAKRLYVGYNSVFIAFLSSAPIATPRAGDLINRSASAHQQFFRIYGGPNRDTPVDPNTALQFAVVVQTASPNDYAGSSLADRFAAFTAAMDAMALPKMATVDRLHPVWQFSNGIVTLSNTYQGDRYHGGNDGKGEDWIGGPNNENPTLIDYRVWPQLKQDVVGLANPTVYQPQKGNMTIRYPGTPTIVYDFNAQSGGSFDPPVAVDDDQTVTSGQTATGNVTSNDSTPNTGHSLQAILVGSPAHGTLNLATDGTYTYSPDDQFTGVDEATYQVTDTIADSNVATLTFTVQAAPADPPAPLGAGGGSGNGCGIGSGISLVSGFLYLLWLCLLPVRRRESRLSSRT